MWTLAKYYDIIQRYFTKGFKKFKNSKNFFKNIKPNIKLIPLNKCKDKKQPKKFKGEI